jgi:RND superfamily putative drug exporter
MSKHSAMTTLTRWVLAHKKLVVALWAMLTVAGVAAVGPANRAFEEQFNIPGKEAFVANSQIVKAYGNGGDIAPLVPVVTLPRGTTVDSAGVRSELAAALAKIQAAVPHSRVASFASTEDRAFVSEDGRTTFALVYTRMNLASGVDPGQADARAAQHAVDKLTVGGSPVHVTGLNALRANAADGAKSGGSSMAVEALIAGGGALLVLGFVFASWMALVPMLMALVAIPTTFLAVLPLATATNVSVIVKFLIGLVGLAIAIDYALLIVVRWREERQRGAGREDAVVAAMQHAGKSVVFSGTTVAISLLALVALPVPFLRSLGIAGMLIPLVSVAVAITLLPVVLAAAGPRLDRRHTGREDRASRGWTAWARIIVRHRWSAAVLSTAVLAGLVFAASTIQLGNPRAESLAQSGPAHTGLNQLERSGIGVGALSPFDTLVHSGDPAQIVAKLEGVDGVRAAIAPTDWRRDGASRPSGPRPDPRRDRRARGHRRRVRPERGLPRRRLRQLPARHRPHRRPDVPAAGPRLPLGDHPPQGGPAEPAVGRCRVGPDGDRLAARLGLARHLGHRSDELDQRGDADRRLRVPVRDLDGLPGVHPQPDARGL